MPKWVQRSLGFLQKQGERNFQKKKGLGRIGFKIPYPSLWIRNNEFWQAQLKTFWRPICTNRVPRQTSRRNWFPSGKWGGSWGNTMPNKGKDGWIRSHGFDRGERMWLIVYLLCRGWLTGLEGCSDDPYQIGEQVGQHEIGMDRVSDASQIPATEHIGSKLIKNCSPLHPFITIHAICVTCNVCLPRVSYLKYKNIQSAMSMATSESPYPT